MEIDNDTMQSIREGVEKYSTGAQAARRKQRVVVKEDGDAWFVGEKSIQSFIQHALQYKISWKQIVRYSHAGIFPIRRLGGQLILSKSEFYGAMYSLPKLS